jgi:hypothetical protein
MPNFTFEEVPADPVFFEVFHAHVYEPSLAHKYHASRNDLRMPAALRRGGKLRTLFSHALQRIEPPLRETMGNCVSGGEEQGGGRGKAGRISAVDRSLDSGSGSAGILQKKALMLEDMITIMSR